MSVTCGLLPFSVAQIDPIEARARLGMSFDMADADIAAACRTLRETAACRYAYAQSRVTVNGAECTFDFGTVHSRDLARALRGRSAVAVLGITLGMEVDRAIAAAQYVSKSQAYVTDALASAMAESFFCHVRRSCLGDTDPPFSPGYGDLPLSFQHAVLAFLCADRTLSVTLNGACLMQPCKSITAIIGVGS